MNTLVPKMQSNSQTVIREIISVLCWWTNSSDMYRNDDLPFLCMSCAMPVELDDTNKRFLKLLVGKGVTKRVDGRIQIA